MKRIILLPVIVLMVYAFSAGCAASYSWRNKAERIPPPPPGIVDDEPEILGYWAWVPQPEYAELWNVQLAIREDGTFTCCYRMASWSGDDSDTCFTGTYDLSGDQCVVMVGGEAEADTLNVFTIEGTWLCPESLPWSIPQHGFSRDYGVQMIGPPHKFTWLVDTTLVPRTCFERTSPEAFTCDYP